MLLHWNAEMQICQISWMRAMNNCHAEKNRSSYALWFESPVGFSPSSYLSVCSLYRNSWLGRLKWWHVFCFSSYRCQCSGPCLISRYSTVDCRSACQPDLHPCPPRVTPEHPGDTECCAPTRCPGACHGSSHHHCWPSLHSPDGCPAQKGEKEECTLPAGRCYREGKE